MTEKIPIRVQFKRMTSTEWQGSTLILLDGELGYETDTGKAKIGNGRDRFSNLKYLAGEKGERGLIGQTGLNGRNGIDGRNAVTGDYNLLLNSHFPDTNIITSGNPTLKLVANDLNGKTSLEVIKTGATSNTWAGIQLKSSQGSFKRGDKLVLRLPIYIYSDVILDGGLYLALKKHSLNKTLSSFDLSNLEKNKWVIYEQKITINEDIDFYSENNWFYLYLVKNGHFKIAQPYISYGEEVPTRWEPNIEDLKLYVTNQQNGQQLKYWYGTQTQFEAVNPRDPNTIYDVVKDR